MSPIHVNLNAARKRAELTDSKRVVASPDGNHFFTSRPDWAGPVPLPFKAAAATVRLLPNSITQPRVLVLGFGMGAVAALMRQQRDDLIIVGVEPDRSLYRSAQQAFAEDNLSGTVTLELNDALSFLNDTGECFDLVLDDCFVVVADELDQDQPYRPEELEAIPALARTRLTAQGLYARNLLEQTDLPLSRQRDRIDQHFGFSAERRFRDWDNVLRVASNVVVSHRLVKTLGS